MLWLSSAGRGRSSKWVWPLSPLYIRTIMRVLPPREIIVHAYLSEDEGVVSNRLGPGLTTRFTKAARREYRFSSITPFRIAQVPVGQQHAGRNGLALLCDTGRHKIRIGRCRA